MIYKTALALTACAAVSASPIDKAHTTVPLKQVFHNASFKNIVASDHARIQHYNKGAHHTAHHGGAQLASAPITNKAVSYVADVTIGGQNVSLIIDTGSSNTWTGARTPYKPGKSGKDTGEKFQVSYGSGQVSGEEYTDVVSFAGLSVKKQSIGAASEVDGITGVDGILGVGPVGITIGSVGNGDAVPTFLNNLYKQGSISSEVLGVYFHPESGSDNNDKNGELTLGGVDKSKYTGSLTYVPTLQSGLASLYWGVKFNSFKFGGSTTLGNGGEGIIDTGTTLIYLPDAAYKDFLSATGGKDDGIATFSKVPTKNLEINIEGSTFTLTPEQYLVPEDQYANLELKSGKHYAWVASGGDGLIDTIIGQKFLESYYSVYDATKSRIGFAARA